MKNIQVIDAAVNAVYDIFSATDEEFAAIFPDGHDVAFIDEVVARHDQEQLDALFPTLWQRRVPKHEAMGIHGTLFFEMEDKKMFYPTRIDEEASNPDGTPLRVAG